MSNEVSAGGPREQRPSVWTLNEVINDVPLTAIEKRFLLLVERGDVASTRAHIEENDGNQEFDKNCTDPMGRSAIIAAVDNENMDMIHMLLEKGVEVKDALLEAIREQYVEGVEALLDWEEKIHKPGELYSWEAVDRAHSKFTPDITPLMLAAHLDNFEILKILLDRGATIPSPHDLKCGCEECMTASESDSLRHSLSRINAFKALSSPSLIVLSSKDPLLTAFELSSELAKLRKLENEFGEEYKEMRAKVHEFTATLLDYTRTQKELEVILNFNPKEGWDPNNKYSLDRLKMAIKYKQKGFVAHPNVQQLLSAIWYDGLPGFKRLSQMQQMMTVMKLFIMFPYYCSMYSLAPTSKAGEFLTKPFVQFVCHKASYLYFLMCLCAASQRIEFIAVQLLGIFVDPYFTEVLADWKHRERGAFPGLFESACVIFVISNICTELRSLWFDGLEEYIEDMWNFVDLFSNMFYMTWIGLRAVSIFVRFRETWAGMDPYYPREEWDNFDPYLLAEGMFAAGMIFSVLKLVHVFSINPHLGPLQISLGRMVIDIIKFFFIYTLVLFAFGCGMNQLLWYYADLEMQHCYSGEDPNVPNFHDEEKSCSIWRRFYNLFETSQSMFWAGFGLVDLVSFDLVGIKSFTRFWALLMFGSYSVINIIVLLNMLIAMMSNSFQIISERSDTEWKFARCKLWISYFDAEDILPPPFNICPSPGLFRDLFKLGEVKRSRSMKIKSVDKTNSRHDIVIKLLVKRYVTTEQQRREEDFGITEDDVMEIRQDISSLKYELVDILRNNGMKTPDVGQTDLAGKKSKQMERRLMKDFQIGCVENLLEEVVTSSKGGKDIFSKLAKAIGKKGGSQTNLKGSTASGDAFGRRKADPIGSSAGIRDKETKRASLRRQISHTTLENFSAINVDEIVKQHPKLANESKGTKVAFAKFAKGKERAKERLAAVKEGTAVPPVNPAPPKSILTKPATTQPAPAAAAAAPKTTPPPPAAPKTTPPPPAAPTPGPSKAPEPPKAAEPAAPEQKPAERKMSAPKAAAAPAAAPPKPPAAAPAPKPAAAAAKPPAKPAEKKPAPPPSKSTPADSSGKSVISGRVLDGWL